IDHDRDTLDRLQLNLGSVLLAARALDQQRRGAARAAARRRARAREEAELRQRPGETRARNTPRGTQPAVGRSAAIALAPAPRSCVSPTRACPASRCAAITRSPR